MRDYKQFYNHMFRWYAKTKTEEAPKKLLPKPLMWIGVNSYIRWKELGAGKEK